MSQEHAVELVWLLYGLVNVDEKRKACEILRDFFAFYSAASSAAELAAISPSSAKSVPPSAMDSPSAMDTPSAESFVWMRGICRLLIAYSVEPA